jgi:dTDP-4-amino-4,6-dideoxygalactose transaminase
MAAFLLAQLEFMDTIQRQRNEKWNYYQAELARTVSSFNCTLPQIPAFASHNSHIYYLICQDVFQRDYLSKTLKKAGIQAYFHYPPLHLSKYYLQSNKPYALPNAFRFSEQLIRLPLFVELSQAEQDHVIAELNSALSKYTPPK